MGKTHDLVAALHRLASVAPIDEAPTLHEAAREIMMLRRQNTGLRDHVLPSIHRVLGCLLPDREHQGRGRVFREFRKIET